MEQNVIWGSGEKLKIPLLGVLDLLKPRLVLVLSQHNLQRAPVCFMVLPQNCSPDCDDCGLSPDNAHVRCGAP